MFVNNHIEVYGCVRRGNGKMLWLQFEEPHRHDPPRSFHPERITTSISQRRTASRQSYSTTLHTIASTHLPHAKNFPKIPIHHHLIHQPNQASSPPKQPKQPTNRTTKLDPQGAARPSRAFVARVPSLARRAHARQNFYPGADWRRKCAVAVQVAGAGGNREKTFNGQGRKDAREIGARSPTAVTAFAAAAYVFVTRM